MIQSVPLKIHTQFFLNKPRPWPIKEKQGLRFELIALIILNYALFFGKLKNFRTSFQICFQIISNLSLIHFKIICKSSGDNGFKI